MRHFLFDFAEMIRFESLENSAFEELAKLSKKLRGEIKYHVYHAQTWIIQLGKANEESRARMQSSLDFCLPLALGIFEPGEFDDTLANQGIIPKESTLLDKWKEAISPVIEKAGLTLPDFDSAKPAYGGRKGYHTEHLKPLIDEMGEVLRSDPDAEW
jgi:ring-1,2-phenylacetyl-CoA epoxidase subunit PaaC